MIYLLCILFPPLAVLMVGRPGSAVLNLFLCLLGWVPGVIHAFMVVGDAKADKRTARLEKAMREGR